MWMVLTFKLDMPPKALLEWHYATCILRYTAIDKPKPDQMAAILVMNFLNAFLCVKIAVL